MDPVVIVGGDLNRRDISSAFEHYVDFSEVDHAPTRGREKLDIIHTNANVEAVAVLDPLVTCNEVPSDHKCVVAKGEKVHLEENWG